MPYTVGAAEAQRIPGLAHVHRATRLELPSRVFAAAVAKPQALLISMLAFHDFLVGELTKTMLTNEVCGCDIFL